MIRVTDCLCACKKRVMGLLSYILSVLIRAWQRGCHVMTRACFMCVTRLFASTRRTLSYLKTRQNKNGTLDIYHYFLWYIFVVLLQCMIIIINYPYGIIEI